MFNKIQKIIKKKGQLIHLSQSEKDSLRENIASFMEYHPVRAGSSSRLLNQRSYLQVLSINRIMPIALIIAVMFSGGVSLAAEQSLPGDMLYPVKVNVNEEVRGLASLSSEARAEWESRITERRLEEAEELALRGDANVELVSKLEEKFDNHAEKLELRIAKFEADGKVEVAERLSANLESTLNNHKRILGLVASSTATSSAALLSLQSRVEMRADKFEEAKDRMEEHFAEKSEAEAKITAENKLNTASNRINAAKNFLGAKSEKMEAESFAKLTAKLAMAESKYAEAKVAFEAENYLESFLLSQEAFRLAKDVQMLPELHGRINKGMGLNLKAVINGSGLNINSDSEVDIDADDVEDGDSSSNDDENIEGEGEENEEGRENRGSEIRSNIDLNLSL